MTSKSDDLWLSKSHAAVNAFFTAPLLDPAGITFSTLNLTVLDSGLHGTMVLRKYGCKDKVSDGKAELDLESMLNLESITTASTCTGQ
jgi:hypothetical protein